MSSGVTGVAGLARVRILEPLESLCLFAGGSAGVVGVEGVPLERCINFMPARRWDITFWSVVEGVIVSDV